ncbi:MBL fold metallo-hydrolase [Arenibacter sp. GZD96]|uniref:MBL fold metallo-hydrolase n=1 Tax=Aurantibrevibacter litoralis TaxID=3106030 RepID=UPI002AFE6BD1|nr:MBL fold metallo-hydrolase [Arenibacter sp. GZD-96]MEA1785193.1 MBL fold metallo-hydrolase [Arenibacter sp. GZD-96]
MHKLRVQFLGAAGTVTGSKIYLETSELRVLIDCGVFQGTKEVRERNWNPLPIDVSRIDIVLLTHGHLDHTGYLPRLLKEGFQGKIMGTGPTLAIAEIILKDSAKIHEEEALKANEEGYSRHKPALPFYSLEEAAKAIRTFEKVQKDQWISLSPHSKVRFLYGGHILGATHIEMDIFEKRFVFSGDLGRIKDPLLYPPQVPKWADFVFVESTYGHKLHPTADTDAVLAALIHRTVNARGNLIIPAFAVERLQTVMFRLWQLYRKNRIPKIQIVVDSPMGQNVLAVFEQYPEWHKLDAQEYKAMCAHFRMVSSYKETWEVIDDPRPKIVIAGSGMVTGGRVLTYLQQWMGKSSTHILLVGYQAEGTRGRQLQEGAHELKIFGKYYPVKAEITELQGLSAHADQEELLQWLGAIQNTPEKVFLLHGEPTALESFRVKIRDTFHWPVVIPAYGETVDIWL